MPELSTYVNSLGSATLVGADVLYLADDEKTTAQAVANLNGLIYKAQISQTGTGAPTLVELINTLGVGTLTPSYTGVGDYEITGFTALTTGLLERNITSPQPSEVNMFILNPTTIRITTDLAGVATNGVLTNSGTNVGSSVITIIKYD